MLLALTWKVTVVLGAVAWVVGWLVMTGWPLEMLTVARNMSKVAPAVWMAFMNIVVCSSGCPDLVRLAASALMANTACAPESGVEAILQGYADAVEAGRAHEREDLPAHGRGPKS